MDMDSIDFDTSKTLQELENSDWGEPPFPSYLVTTVYALRHKPLDQFTTEDLRIMIGQGHSLAYLIPLALNVVWVNPFARGHYREGDLLDNILGVDDKFWQERKEFWYDVESLIEELESIVGRWRERYPSEDAKSG